MIFKGADDTGVNGRQRGRTELSRQTPVVSRFASLAALGAPNAMVGVCYRSWNSPQEVSKSVRVKSLRDQGFYN